MTRRKERLWVRKGINDQRPRKGKERRVWSKQAYAYREGGLRDSEGRGASGEGKGGDETEHGYT
jgi:hypothetical protein